MKSFSSYVTDWEKNAGKDPYWAILTKQDGLWENDIFFQTGTKEIDTLLKYIKENQIPVPFRGVALDFGCGIGRLTVALADYFDQVTGIDISAKMIEKAKKIHSSDKLQFVANPHPNLDIFPNQSFDFIYSNIVFQHIPKKNQISYLKDFSRIIKSKGWIIVQIPSKRIYQSHLHSAKGFLGSLLPTRVRKAILKSLRNKDKAINDFHIEMHPIPENQVLSKAKQLGLELSHITFTNSTQPSFCGDLQFLEKEEAITKEGFLSPLYFFKKQ